MNNDTNAINTLLRESLNDKSETDSGKNETDRRMFDAPESVDDYSAFPNPTVHGRKALVHRYFNIKDELSAAQRNTIVDWLTDSDEKGLSKASYYFNTPPNYVHERGFDAVCFNRVIGRDKEKKRLAAVLSRCESSSYRGCKILLVGPAGCGKSTLISAAKRAVCLPSFEIDAAAMGAADTNGMTSLYSNSTPALMIEKSAQAGCTENCIIIRNIDLINMEGEKDGNPYVTMCRFLKEMTHNDRYLDQLPVSYRNARIIATAVSKSAVPTPLLSLFDVVIELRPYTVRELRDIAKPMIIRLRMEYGKPALKFTRHSLDYALSQYCCNARSLEENLRAIMEEVCNGETVKEPVIDSVLSQRADETDPALLLHRNRDYFTADMKERFYELQSVIVNPRTAVRERDLAVEKLRLLTQLGKPPVKPVPRSQFSQALDMSHYGMSRAKTIISDCYAASAPEPLMLLSPYPGVGKTSLAASTAKAGGVPLIRVNLNSVTNTFELFGSSAGPSPLTVQLAKAATSSVVILLDEVDKFSGQNLLLDMIETKQYKDEFLNIVIPLKNAFIIFTGNDVSSISPYLLDRCTAIRIDPYTDSQKRAIIHKYILSDMEKESGPIRISDHAVRVLLDRCTAAGLREVKSVLKTVVRHLSGNGGSITVTEADVRKLTDAAYTRGNLAPGAAEPGVVRGLAVTGSGEGMAFSVECIEIDGGSELTVLGLADNDVRESAMRALCFFKSLGFKTKSYVVSYAEGSVKKSGSSAGAATALALYSAITKQPVPPDIAVTGELSLKGNIYAVGGVEQKLDGALRAGCSTVFIPKENYDNMLGSGFDFDSCGVGVIPVKHISEIIDYLTAAKAEEARCDLVDISKGA